MRYCGGILREREGSLISALDGQRARRATVNSWRLAAALATLFVSCRSLPRDLDRATNRVSLEPPYRVGEQAQAFHDSLLVADFHADSLLLGRDLGERADIEAVVANIRHVADRLDGRGIGHVGLGSDFDGMGEVTHDASGMALLTEALLREPRFDRADIRKIMGENIVRLLRASLAADARE